MRRATYFFLAVALLPWLAAEGKAGFISSRSTLNAALINPVTEGFESNLIPIPSNKGPFLLDTTAGVTTAVTQLNNSTVIHSQGNPNLPNGTYGPGLVLPGATYSSKLATGETALGPLQWDGTNYRQATSRKLDAAQNKTINISFTPNAAGFGVDLATFGNVGATTFAPLQAQITVYDQFNTVLGTETVTLNVDSGGAPITTFVGFLGSNANQKISSVDITSLPTTGQNIEFSPLIDNVEYSTSAIPEPASILSAGVAIAGLLFYRLRKRK